MLDESEWYARTWALKTNPISLNRAAATIWRFINMRKFRDLMETTEFYFCRADLFPDEREGLPPEEYLATFAYIHSRERQAAIAQPDRQSLLQSTRTTARRAVPSNVIKRRGWCRSRADAQSEAWLLFSLARRESRLSSSA